MFLSIQMLFRRHTAVTAAQSALARGELADAHRDLERFLSTDARREKPCSHHDRALALRGQLDAALSAAARPYTNKETLNALEPICAVPAHRFFVTEDSYAFDVKELDRYVRTSGKFDNPYTNQPLSMHDYDRLMAHPDAFRVRVWARELAKRGSLISHATRRELGLLAARLAGGRKLQTIASPDDAAAAVGDFANYMDALSTAERRALDGFVIGGARFDDTWKMLGKGRYCTAVFSQQLRRALKYMAPVRRELALRR